jgi:cytochrome c oxidase subunit 3/cytochrome o ubiquinol oxidase subunit 3
VNDPVTADIPTAPPPPPPAHPTAELGLEASQWGMLAFLVSEAALFSTLIVVYLSFLGKDDVGPSPREALLLPLAIGTTLCLLSSSATIHRADGEFRRGDSRAFRLWWSITIALGLAFLAGTAYEWHELITEHHLTIGRNLFGSTFYTLVGFHGLHVTGGLAAMLTVLLVRPRPGPRAVELVSWYWHFVDVVWVAVFSVVYLYGR